MSAVDYELHVVPLNQFKIVKFSLNWYRYTEYYMHKTYTLYISPLHMGAFRILSELLQYAMS